MAFWTFTLTRAPSKLENVNFLIKNEKSLWKEKILQAVLPMVKSGTDLSPQFTESLRKNINSLPWVKKCEVKAIGNILTIEIWEERASFYLTFNKKIYTIGKNGCVLETTSHPRLKIPIFFFKGKISPFLTENSCLKLKNSVRILTELLRNRLKEIELEGYKPEITLLDTGVQLAFHTPPFLVYLGMEKDEWEKFIQLLKERKLFKPGIYDFRYSQLLLIKGRRRECYLKRF